VPAAVGLVPAPRGLHAGQSGISQDCGFARPSHPGREREREPVATPGFSLDVPFCQSQLKFHFMQSCSCNAYEINEFVKKGPSMMNAASVELGGAVYPTIRYVK
jgi:hypothetical protein